MTDTQTKVAYTTVNAQEYAEKIQSPDIFLLDVRTPDEYKEGHIKGAYTIDVTNPDFVEYAVNELPKDKTIAVYCQGGKRSAKAAALLTQNGFTILNLDGGIQAWIASGLPTT